MKRTLKRLKNWVMPKLASAIDAEKAEYCFYINYLTEGMTAFDVGANVGELTVLFARFVGATGSVHSFEATPATFEKLTRLSEAANLTRVKLNNVAVAERESLMMFNTYDEQHASWNTLAVRDLKSHNINIASPVQQEVQAITLDAYCEQHKIEFIDLLKIDVEGAELRVLLGAERLFREKRVRCCSLEYGGTMYDMGDTPEQVEAFLEKTGYRIDNVVKNDPVFPGRENLKTAPFAIHIVRPKA